MSNHAPTKLPTFPPVPAAKHIASTSQMPESGTPIIAIVILRRWTRIMPRTVPIITPRNNPNYRLQWLILARKVFWLLVLSGGGTVQVGDLGMVVVADVLSQEFIIYKIMNYTYHIQTIITDKQSSLRDIFQKALLSVGQISKSKKRYHLFFKKNRWKKSAGNN